MPAIRLTNTIRSDICNLAMRKRFKSEAERLVKLNAETAIAIYNLRYSAAERRLMLKLPAGWLETAEGINTLSGGQRDYIRFNGALHYNGPGSMLRGLCKEAKSVSLPFPRHEASTQLTAEQLVLYKKLQQTLKEVSDTYGKARSTLEGYLAGFSTVEKLVAAWPECEPFVPRNEQAAIKIGLPAIATSTLNELLGLKAAA